jgi:hypothetical protein
MCGVVQLEHELRSARRRRGAPGPGVQTPSQRLPCTKWMETMQPGLERLEGEPAEGQ